MRKSLQKYLSGESIQQDWLGFLRIAVALFALLHFLSIQADFDLLFSYKGLVQPDILNAKHTGPVPTITDIHKWLHKVWPVVSYNGVLHFFRYAYITALAFLSIGLFSRFSALLALLTQLILINSIQFYQYGADSFTTILLFYCFLFPTGKVWSFDNRIFRNKRAATPDNVMICLRLLQVHICIVYFIGGFEKVLGFNWRNGEALWKALSNHNTRGLIQVDFLKNTPVFFIMGWATIITEGLYPVFINIQKTRGLWLCLTIGLHLGIAIFLGLFFFSTIMIIFNLAAYYVPYLKEKKKAGAATDTGPAISMLVQTC
jgi:Vitamin K-dependent gamma-carboxylase